MAMTLTEIEAHLDAMELKYGYPSDGREHIGLSFGTDHYRDEDGDDSLRMIILLEQDGRFLKVFAPMVYKVPEGPTREAVFMALLHVSWRTKMVQFEYDMRDGEVRAIVEFPIEDGTVTEKQLERAIRSLVAIVDKYHPLIQRAIDKGEVVPLDDDPSEDRVRSLLAVLERAVDADPAALEAALAALGGAAPSDDEGGPTEL